MCVCVLRGNVQLHMVVGGEGERERERERERVGERGEAVEALERYKGGGIVLSCVWGGGEGDSKGDTVVS